MTSQTNCYICGDLLNNGLTLNSDHLIPDSMFSTSDANKPQLVVHKNCNGNKSMDDRWFVKKVLFMCGTNIQAEVELTKFLQKATDQERFLRLDGQQKSKTKDAKLAHTIFDEFTAGSEHVVDGRVLIEMKRKDKLGKDTRLINYAKQMCRGLYILNIPGSNPKLPQIRWFIYDALRLNNRLGLHFNGMKRIFDASKQTNFMQNWANRIFYIGSRVEESADKGYIYIEFYDRVGILAFFNE